MFEITLPDKLNTFLQLIINKAAGPDNKPCHVLNRFANQLADVITDIFNISHWQERWLSTIFLCPKPKRSSVSGLNDYKLVLQYFKVNITASLNPPQYAFRTNRSTEDALSTSLHSLGVFNTTQDKNNNIRMSFADFSSAANTISPMKADWKTLWAL